MTEPIRQKHTPQPPKWFRPRPGVVWGWILVAFALSWLSGFADQSCADEACADRAQTGWAVLMVLQLVWIVAVFVLGRLPAWRRWALVAGLVLPALTLWMVASLAYPPEFSF